MRYLVVWLALLPARAICSEVPSSLELWTTRAEYFWTMDFSDEAKFKEKLKAHWAKIYAGDRLTELSKWIDEGNLESEYYSSTFSGLKDMTVDSFVQRNPRLYETRTAQSSCYSLDYNPPVLETVVEMYKVTNLTQKEVDEWNNWAWREPRAEVCLKTRRLVTLRLDKPNGFVVGESWTALASEITLRPNKPLQPTPDGAAERRRWAE